MRRYSVMPKRIILLALPALAAYLFVLIIPTIRGSRYSLTDWNGLNPEYEFVGLQNFRDAFTNDASSRAIFVTAVIAISTTILQNIIGLLLAVGVNTRIKSRNLLRVFFFTPVVMTPVVIAYLWQYLLAPNGPVNSMIAIVSPRETYPSWLGNENLALLSIITVMVWQFSGFAMVIYLAGLQNIPEEILEAASIDGAGSRRKFWSITLPMLAPAVTINIMLSIISGLKAFDQVWVLTGGGPAGLTNTLSTTIYRNAFQYGEFGSSIALALILTFAIAIISIFQYRPLLRREVAL